MKFGQLIEHKKRNIFLENHTQNALEILFPDPFLKTQNLAYLWINSLKFYTACFIVCQVYTACFYIYYQNILKLSCRPLTFTSCKAFSKNKKRSGTSLSASFSAWFLKKNISLVLLYCLTKFHCLFAFTSQDIVQYVYCNCLLTKL